MPAPGVRSAVMRRYWVRLTQLAAGVLLLAGRALSLPAQRAAYDGGVTFATGRYGLASATSTLILSNGVTLSAPRWRLFASVPLIAQDGGAVQFAGGGAVPTGGMPGHTSGSGMGSGMMTATGGMRGSMHAGVGDPVVRADAVFLRSADARRELRVVTAAKVPLAGPEGGVGTGKWDLGTGLSSASAFSGAFLFADATYWQTGRPDSLPLRNALAYAAAVGRPLTANGRLALLASLSGSTPLLRGVGAPLSGALVLTRVSSANRVLGVTLSLGLTRTAPKAAVGLAWRILLGSAGS